MRSQAEEDKFLSIYFPLSLQQSHFPEINICHFSPVSCCEETQDAREALLWYSSRRGLGFYEGTIQSVLLYLC